MASAISRAEGIGFDPGELLMRAMVYSAATVMDFVSTSEIPS
jgi:hypothetical protein